MLHNIYKIWDRVTHFKEESTVIKIIHNILQINNLTPSDQYDAVIQPLTRAIKNSIDYSKYLSLSEQDKELFRTLVAKKLNEMAGKDLFKSLVFQNDAQLTRGIFQSGSHLFPTIFKKMGVRKPLTLAENEEPKEHELKDEEISETYLTGIKPIDNLILHYVNFTHDEKESTRNYSLLTMGITLFEKGVAVVALLGHVARGEQSAADAMLQKNPFLLLGYGRTTDYTCTEDGVFRILEGTAYRIALGAKDVKFHPDEECMVEMITRHFKRLPNWEVEMKKQYDDQFPPGWEAQERARAVLDSVEINKVFQAIHDTVLENDTYDACEKACEPALKEFRKYLDKQIKERIFKTGFHFNDWPVDEKEQKDITYGILGEAFKLYIHYFPIFGGSYSRPKNKLCWDKIVGYIERFFPACYAQAFCSDLYDYVNQGGKLDRRLSLKWATNYCLVSFLGDFWVGI